MYVRFLCSILGIKCYQGIINNKSDAVRCLFPLQFPLTEDPEAFYSSHSTAPFSIYCFTFILKYLYQFIVTLKVPEYSQDKFLLMFRCKESFCHQPFCSQCKKNSEKREVDLNTSECYKVLRLETPSFKKSTDVLCKYF